MIYHLFTRNLKITPQLPPYLIIDLSGDENTSIPLIHVLIRELVTKARQFGYLMHWPHSEPMRTHLHHKLVAHTNAHHGFYVCRNHAVHHIRGCIEWHREICIAQEHCISIRLGRIGIEWWQIVWLLGVLLVCLRSIEVRNTVLYVLPAWVELL